MGRGRIKDLVARGDFSEHLELGSPVVSTVCRGGSLGDRSDCFPRVSSLLVQEELG